MWLKLPFLGQPQPSPYPHSCQIGSIHLIGIYHVHTSAQCFSSDFLYITMPPKGKGKKTWGASSSASPSKWARNVAGSKQAHVPTKQAFDESDTEDLLSNGQATVPNGFEGMMNMLVDISSRLQATKKECKRWGQREQQHARRAPLLPVLTKGGTEPRPDIRELMQMVCWWFPVPHASVPLRVPTTTDEVIGGGRWKTMKFHWSPTDRCPSVKKLLSYDGPQVTNTYTF